MSGQAIEAVSICHRFGAEEILHDISLAVADGESLAITGPSGGGKSTLISILALMLEPSAGDVRYRGCSVARQADDDRSRLRNRAFGFVFQNPQLIGSLPVLANVLVPARLARRRDCESEARRLLSELGLGHRLDHLPHQLSIGQKRRVAVARALLLDPKVVFADEPTNDLDGEMAEKLGHFLLGQAKRGKALVYATHDQALCARASRVVVLSGKVLHPWSPLAKGKPGHPDPKSPCMILEHPNTGRLPGRREIPPYPETSEGLPMISREFRSIPNHER